MGNLLARLANLGVIIPEVLLPASQIDIEKWAVIACDQWTQDKMYWEKVADLTHGSPSTLNIIYPEVYLGSGNDNQRIEAIHNTMNEYIGSGGFDGSAVFAKPVKAGIFVERECTHGIRKGFVLAVDLEKYDWRIGSSSLIRVTEETIEERLPQRMKIRAGAPLECPHILLLVEDPENILMSIFEKLLRGAPYIYESNLMTGGGSVRGRCVYRQNDWDFLGDTLHHFYRDAVTSFGEKNAFLFAVGDGNHSLAAAKAVWEQYKAAHAEEKNIMEHNARYALVEIVSLYDNSIRFEPIHRVVLNTSVEGLLRSLRESGVFTERSIKNIEELKQLVNENTVEVNRYGFISRGSLALFEAKGGKAATVDLEPVLRDFARKETVNGKTPLIDYIHGIDELFRLAQEKEDTAGIMLPPFHKEGFFRTIAENGPLPRKSFSMGSAEDKRFYLESRKLF